MCPGLFTQVTGRVPRKMSRLKALFAECINHFWTTFNSSLMTYRVLLVCLCGQCGRFVLRNARASMDNAFGVIHNSASVVHKVPKLVQLPENEPFYTLNYYPVRSSSSDDLSKRSLRAWVVLEPCLQSAPDVLDRPFVRLLLESW